MIALRPLEREDLVLVDRWAASAGLERYASRLRPIGATVCRHDPPRGLLWYVIVRDGVDVGTVWLEPGEAPGECVLGIYLGYVALYGRGTGSEAIRLALEECRAHGGTHTVALRVRRDNARAIACYRKLGFAITEGGVKTPCAVRSVAFYEMRLQLGGEAAPCAPHVSA